jgi:hypothetical protein
MDIDIRVRFVYQLPLTVAHIDALMVLSSHHYDALCKEASQQKGFLVYWKLMLDCHAKMELDEDYTVDATSHQIDIMLKILESRSLCVISGLIDETADVLCRELIRDLSGASQLANNHYKQWQITYYPRKLG